jgi:hypothetical protein
LNFIFERQILKEIQVERTAFGSYLLQNVLDAWSFLVGQSGHANGRDDRVWVCIANRLPGWKMLSERFKSPIAVDIVGILGKDG